MPNIGEIRTAQELGLAGSIKRIWLSCKQCGKERWTPLYGWRTPHEYCGGCSQRLGGKQKLPRGKYKIRPDKLIRGTCHLCGIEYPATIQYFLRNKRTKNGLGLGLCRKCSNKARRKREVSTIQGKINRRISAYIYQTLNGTKNYRHWEDLVGYTTKQLIRHLGRHFKDDMSWDNYGKWHIDHIIPQSAFHFTSPDDIDFKRCWALSNLQPLWATDNVDKGAKISKPFQPSLKIK